jgi:oligopeptidase B
LVKHNHERIDDYYWMKDRENPELIGYLNAENDYTTATLKSTETDQKFLFEEMKSRIKEDDSSVPYLNNGYWYYSRYEKGKEYPIHCRKKESLENKEEILLNENEEAKNHPYYDMVSFAITKDNSKMAFAEDITGRRNYQVRIKDLVSGEISEVKIKNVSNDLVWHNDGDLLYFGEKDLETLRPSIIKSYCLSTEEIKTIYEEKDETYICTISLNKDFKHIIISSHSTLTTEYRIKKADDSEDFEVFLEREDGHEYYLELKGNVAFIKSNKNAANFRLCSCTVEQRGFDDWKEIQGHQEDVFVEDFEILNAYFVVQEKENGLSRLRIYETEKWASKIVPNREETYMLYLGTNPAMDQQHLRIGYSSMTTPHSVIDIDLASFDETLKKQQEVLGDFKAENYKSERIWATANDGTKVPISIVYRKDSYQKDGNNPLLIYAYGSYGSTTDPYFSGVRLSLLDRGFVFAIAHIRGGEYMGRQWYEDGKLKKKINTFTDFINCTEHLIKERITDSNKVFAMGGSAGGLLMGAVSNMSPQLWAGIVSNVPFVDVVTTMLDDTIPLTTGEYDEWGNPNDKSYYEYMLSYSPYDNIEKKEYPPMLITSGLHDSQVQYWEPTKYIAKLRDRQTNNAPVLLQTNMEAGHGGASGRFEALKEIALEYAFIFWLLDIKIKG